MKGYNEPGVYDVRVKTTTKDGEIAVDYEMEYIGTNVEAKVIEHKLRHRAEREYGAENILEVEFSCRVVSRD